MNKIQLINPEIEKYAEEFSDAEHEILYQISVDTNEKLRYSDMISGNQVTGLLSILCKVSGASKIAEIGVFTGYSTLVLAESLPLSGKLYCLEMNKKYLDIALPNLQKSKSFDKIEFLVGNARERIIDLPDELDLVFLDADKEYYPDYYEILFSKLRVGGLLLADNVFWYGTVLESDKNRKSKAIHKFNQLVKSDPRVQNVMLTVRDGLMLIRKISN